MKKNLRSQDRYTYIRCPRSGRDQYNLGIAESGESLDLGIFRSWDALFTNLGPPRQFLRFNAKIIERMNDRQLSANDTSGGSFPASPPGYQLSIKYKLSIVCTRDSTSVIRSNIRTLTVTSVSVRSGLVHGFFYYIVTHFTFRTNDKNKVFF